MRQVLIVIISLILGSFSFAQEPKIIHFEHKETGKLLSINLPVNTVLKLDSNRFKTIIIDKSNQGFLISGFQKKTSDFKLGKKPFNTNINTSTLINFDTLDFISVNRMSIKEKKYSRLYRFSIYISIASSIYLITTSKDDKLAIVGLKSIPFLFTTTYVFGFKNKKLSPKTWKLQESNY